MKKLSLLFMVLLLSYCTSDVLERPADEKQSQKEDKVGQAIDFLNGTFLDNEIEGAASGSAVAPKTVNLSKASIDTIYDLPDENNKPFLQLVVFKPKAYAVVSVIKNVPNPPVLFYGQGKFNVKKPDAGLITYLQEFLAKSVRGRKTDAGSDGHDLYDPIVSSMVVSKTSTTLNKKGPLLNMYWNQWYPYNNTVKTRKGQDFPVGCVAVATGYIMAHHKKPAWYNWSRILQTATDSIKKCGGLADLLWDVGQGVKMQYGTYAQGGSGAYDKDVIPYLKNHGYSVSNLLSYNYNKVKCEIDANRPVYLSGYAKKKYNGFWADLFGNPYTYFDGHAWVGDGYKTVQYAYKNKHTTKSGVVSYSTTYKTYSYIHMNWGWGSQDYIRGKGWCTYNYWLNTHHGGQNYQYSKIMITVKP